ncbi:MAG TPA: hypothetical protein VFH50_03305 [Acidimicrobiales bacterium]|nr:hypothetical protein [Acidimicrobiales bacterium]
MAVLPGPGRDLVAGAAPLPLNRTRLAAAGLVAVPVAVFLVPLAFGHILLPGDSLTQNYPLRVLSGADVRHGVLPLWNPYIWSGTALLGGFNAGSLYPATLLFSFLPGPLAWGLGQALVSAGAGTGMLLFLRGRGRSVLAASLAAVVFAWSGFMAAQLAHTGLVEGMAWTPWILRAVDHLAGRDRPVLWTGVLGLAGGLVCLGGDPRAITNVSIVAAVYAGWRWWRAPAGTRARFGGLVVAGAVVAGLLGAGQLVPGLAFQAGSQRAASSYEAFAAGSLAPPLLLLEAFPFVLGGFGSLHLPAYAGDYNLPEISGYLGLLGLAGALGVAASWRRSGEAVGVWVVLAVVGIVLALGQYTPLARLLVHVPLYGGQRLQSRNLGVADVAGVVLFSVWVDRFVTRGWRGGRLARAMALAAPTCVLALVLTGLFWPGGVAHWLRNEGALLPRGWAYAAASLVVAGAVAVVLLAGHRWDGARRARVVAVITLVDVGFFFANAAYGWEPTSAVGSHQAADAQLVSALPPGSRYAVYDPDLGYPGYVWTDDEMLRVPDLNVLGGVPSVQGYGSVVQGAYDAGTGSHVQGALDPGVLGDQRADQLQLGLVLVGPSAPADVTRLLVPPRWKPVGPVAGLAAFRNTDALAPAVFEVPGGNLGTAAQSVSPPVRVWGPRRDGSAVYRVDTPAPVVLVRSEAWAPGWKATLTPVGTSGRRGPGSTFTAVVGRSGFLQAATIPPGHWDVRFRYRPGRTYLGILVSLLGALAGMALVVAGLRGRPLRPRPRQAVGQGDRVG